MGDYIDRENYCKTICRCDRDYCDKGKCPIWTAPSADVRPAVRGRWSWRTGSEYRCTNCGRHTHVDEVMEEPAYNYCPYCGADMKGGSGGEE